MEIEKAKQEKQMKLKQVQQVQKSLDARRQDAEKMGKQISKMKKINKRSLVIEIGLSTLSAVLAGASLYLGYPLIGGAFLLCLFTGVGSFWNNRLSKIKLLELEEQNQTARQDCQKAYDLSRDCCKILNRQIDSLNKEISHETPTLPLKGKNADERILANKFKQLALLGEITIKEQSLISKQAEECEKEIRS